MAKPCMDVNLFFEIFLTFTSICIQQLAKETDQPFTSCFGLEHLLFQLLHSNVFPSPVSTEHLCKGTGGWKRSALDRTLVRTNRVMSLEYFIHLLPVHYIESICRWWRRGLRHRVVRFWSCVSQMLFLVVHRSLYMALITLKSAIN